MRTEQLIAQVRKCVLCRSHLPNPPRPILQAGSQAQVLIIGQAPGRKAHASHTPWNDASGDRLRAWLGVQPSEFYDPAKFALVPMGFCYPGRGRSGDLPPRTECAPEWHEKLIRTMPIKVSLLIGQYAQNYYLGGNQTLTERVRNWRRYQPEVFVLPHPSPRNNIWLKRHSWFERDVIPAMREKMQQLLA